MTQLPVPVPVAVTPEAQKDMKSLSSSQDSCKSSHCFMGCVRREHKRKTEEALITPMSNNRGSGVPVTPRHFRSCWPSTSIEWQQPWTLHSGGSHILETPEPEAKSGPFLKPKNLEHPDITPRDFPPHEWH